MATKKSKATTKPKIVFDRKFGFKKSKRTITEIVVHTTATVEGKDYTIADITAWHKARKFDTIGYHYVVNIKGDLLFGRDVDTAGAHVSGHNATTIGICYIGGNDANGKSKDTRNAAQKNTLIEALRELRTLYPTAKILGHRDFPNVAKDCPCFDAIPEYKNI